ncbi:MAG: InlB B-repeat-containing protein, partial [Lachnospiraceae bacterium]|nr:InlB B-repeat-containing protein [Lachnospiraceae bacterium]
AVTTENVKPTDESLYTTDIPAKTSAGTYYVWYKAVGDINDNDSKAVCITVVIKPQSLTDASVTVDTKDKTVTVKNDRAIVPAEAYHVIYFTYKKIEGGESLKRVGTDFPEEYGEYIAAVVANENSGYIGENRSEPFAIGTTGSVSFNQDENSDETVQTAVKNVESSNLSDFAEELAEEGKFVKVELEITPVKAEEVDQNSVNGTKKIAEGLFVGFDADQVATEYFEIDIKKYVNNEDAGIISDTKNPLEITLTYDKTKMSDPVVVRTHNGETKVFEKLSARPAEKADYKDATYYVGDGVIYLYSQFFSDYAIIYSTVKTYNVDIVTGTSDKISKTVAEGSNVDLPTGLSKSGYTFSGWYSDEAYTKVWNANDPVTADTTIYAKWTKNTVPYVPSTPVETPTATPTPTVTPAPTETPTVTPAPVKDSITAEEAASGSIKLNAGFKVYPKKSDIVVKWGKVDNADRYVIYAAYCKKGRKCAKIATLDGDVNSYKFSELNGKPINTKKNIKLYVVAYRKVNGKYKKITRSITAHIVGSGSKKYSNVKGINVESTKITLSLDDNTAAPSSITLKPTAVLKDSSKKMLRHTAEFRYASSKSSVATVGKDGTIKAKGIGTCYIYVYAQNGYAKKVKVTVK